MWKINISLARYLVYTYINMFDFVKVMGGPTGRIYYVLRTCWTMKQIRSVLQQQSFKILF